MFRLNGIYRAQNIMELMQYGDTSIPYSEGEPYIRTYREYVTSSGEKIEDVIFDEYGYSEDFNGYLQTWAGAYAF